GRRLSAWAADGGLLVIAPGEPRLAKRVGLTLHETGAAAQEARVETKDASAQSVVAVPDRRWLSIPASEADPLLARGGSPYGAWIEKGKGAVMVLADDYLFENIALAVADDPGYLVRVLHQVQPTVHLFH